VDDQAKTTLVIYTNLSLASREAFRFAQILLRGSFVFCQVKTPRREVLAVRLTSATWNDAGVSILIVTCLDFGILETLFSCNAFPSNHPSL
jgi:hypothetical protein